MSKLPPTEKLPLAVRKNIRDEWESKKDQLASDLSSLLGTEWTFDVDLNQIHAYAQPGSYGHNSLGSCLAEYFDGAIRRLREFLDYDDEETAKETAREINTICHAHAMTIDVDLDKRFTYNGCDVTDDGKLRILFGPDYLDTNISSALERDVLRHALNAGDKDADGTGLSFIARTAKRTAYDAHIEPIRSAIAEALAREDIKLTPNLEDTFAKLKVESERPGTSLDKRYWEASVPEWTKNYFDGLLSQLRWQKFDSDDMLQEGFNEAVDKGEIAFRIVDALKNKSYCEFEIEDGVFYLQCTAKTWGTNLTDAAAGIIDKL